LRAAIILRDLRDGTVEMTTEMEEVTSLENQSPPTAASVMMLGAMALFETGILAQAGAIAVKALENEIPPTAAVKERYGNGDTDP